MSVTHRAARVRSATLLLLCATTGGCDRIQALVDGEPAANAAAPSPTNDAKAPAIADAEPSTKPDTKPGTEPSTASDTKATAAAKAADAAPSTAAAPTEAAPTPVADAPCIVGRWRAIEYLAEVRRAIAKDPTLAKLKRTKSGGLLGYEVGVAADGKGTVKAKAEDLRYVFTGKVEGFAVTLTFTLDGEAEAAYTLEGDDRIVVGEPSRDTLVARASAKVEGFSRFSKSPKVDHEFAGSYVYECTDETLKIWRNGKSGEALDFERER